MKNIVIGILLSSTAYSQTNSIEIKNAILENIYYWDQHIRKTKNNCSERDIKYYDSINILTVDNYILKYGFPMNEPLSRNAYYGIYYAIQHADLSRQQQYLDKFKTLADRGIIEMKKYAMMYDRILVRSIGKQKYGEQMQPDLSHNFLEYVSFINIDSVQIYRKQLGLDSLDLNKKIRLIRKE
jgi:hypothetical protein